MIKKYILIITLFSILASCKKEVVKEKTNRLYSIDGDWCTYFMDDSDEIKNLEEFQYTEVYFNNSKMYRFSNFGGVLNPLNYKVLKDSLFYYRGNKIFKNTDYVGSLIFRSVDTLFIVNKEDTLKLYSLREASETMSHYIKKESDFQYFDSNHNDYLDYFLERRKKSFTANADL